MENAHIEIAHIYQDSLFGNQQEKSIELFHRYNLNNNQTISVLVDDYNIKDKKWDIQYLIRKMKENNINLDYIFFESQFHILVKELIERLPKECIKIESFKKENKKVVFFNKNNKKIALLNIFDNYTKSTCIALSTCWKLCKLGYFNFPKNSFISLNKKEIQRYKTVSILENKFQFIEDSVSLIIKEIDPNFNNRINYIYY